MREKNGAYHTIGELKDGKPHGQGKMTGVFGAIYGGEWKSGFLNGNGKFVYPDGEVFEGWWKDYMWNGIICPDKI